MRDPFFDGAGALGRFEAMLFDDATLQQSLAELRDPEAFVAACVEAAAARGIALQPEALAGRVRPDPLGIDALLSPPPLRAAPPAGDWLPVAVAPAAGSALRVEWAHFAGAPLDDAFFAVSAQKARARPFNAAFRCATELVADEGQAPDAIIFHQSRSGSTALSRMLAAWPGAVSLSEPLPVDAVLRLAGEAERAGALRAILAPFGRRAERSGGPFIVKADAAHSLFLPVFRAAFPATPWLFLFREPTEILVSQMRAPGAIVVPDMADGGVFGIEAAARASAEDYCARVLARIGEAALDHRGLRGGLFVDYAAFPDAVVDRILPHFGLKPDAEARSAMAKALAMDAKHASRPFVSDAGDKRRDAGAPVCRAAEAWMRPVYERLTQASVR
jgi:hypothetical protein